MFLRFNTFLLFIFVLLTGVSATSAQQKSGEKDKSSKVKSGDLINGATAEQLAESVIIIYGGLGGRENMKQIRKTTFERGKTSIVNAEGKTEKANYERYVLRADNLNKEKIRFDQEFPDAKYALIYSEDKVFGIFNDSVFTPREDASKGFSNQIWHGLEALLRYKENESKVELVKKDKIMGVDYFILDVTDKKDRQTRFYVSAKYFKVMMLEYTEDGVKFKRKFYDYNYAQGTLVPYRSVLWADGKQIEETEIQTISFGQKVEAEIFQGS